MIQTKLFFYESPLFLFLIELGVIRLPKGAFVLSFIPHSAVKYKHQVVCHLRLNDELLFFTSVISHSNSYHVSILALFSLKVIKGRYLLESQ